MAERWRGIFKLMEEMAELQQVLAKLAAFPDGRHPDMAQGASPLLERLGDEIADVEAAIDYLRWFNPAVRANGRRRVEKLLKFREGGLSGVRPAEHDDAQGAQAKK